MEIKQAKRHMKKYKARCLTVAAMALALTLHPVFSFTAEAYPYDYDIDYGYSYGSEPNLTNITKTYDDGTKYSTEFKYDTQGNVIYINTVEADGSKRTVNRTYTGDSLISETDYEYDAYLKSEMTKITEYQEAGSHEIVRIKNSDGDESSSETWYDAQGNLLTSNMVSSDGSVKQEEQRYEDGDLTYYRLYEKDGVTQTQMSEEVYYATTEDDLNIYTVERIIDASGTSQTESWYSSKAKGTYKIVETAPDGGKATANYIFDESGEEILYVKTLSDGTTIKRETVNYENGYKKIETDDQGNITTTNYSRDLENGSLTRESMYKGVDGSSSYQKSIWRDYIAELSITRERAADGTETYDESNLESDGSATRRQKTADGTITVTKLDANGIEVSKSTTLPDGTRSITIWERLANGEPSAELTQYQDGSIDRIDYEYDTDGDLAKQTEVRRNGVSAVTLWQYGTEGTSVDTETMIFNNGCQIFVRIEEFNEDAYQFTVAYSTGDISEDIFREDEKGNYYLKTTYRDGRVEESSISWDEGANEVAQYESVELYSQRIDDYIGLAWAILPS